MVGQRRLLVAPSSIHKKSQNKSSWIIDNNQRVVVVEDNLNGAKMIPVDRRVEVVVAAFVTICGDGGSNREEIQL